jgi:WD40 repeat protein/serine/threonine protein kinase
LDDWEKSYDASLPPQEQAIQFLMAHEQALEERALPPDPPVALLDQLQPAELAGLLRLIDEQRRKHTASRIKSNHGKQGGVATVTGFRILEEVGRGGMGVVYKAIDTSLDRVVALKMILGGGHNDQAHQARFRSEAATIARLHHPNIVEIYRVGEHEGIPYLVLEYCEGGGLDRKLTGTPLRAREAATIVKTLALAVDYAHTQKVIHRDLKPANVLLGAEGALKVTDFGLAKLVDQKGLTTSGTIIGTPEYMAPEQARGNLREVGPRSDVYAMGVILYEILTGRPPFRENAPLDTLQKVVKDEPVPPRQLTREIPRDLETICLKAIEKEARRRYASAFEFAADLQLWLDGRPITARPPSLSYLSVRFVSRHRAPLAIVAAVIALILGSAVSAFVRIDRERRATLVSNELLEQQLYATRIAIAERELAQNHDIALAERLLQQCRADLRGWEWHYLNRLLDGGRPPLGDHNRGLWMADFSPDGRLIATVSIDGTAKIWDATTGNLIRDIDADAGAIPLGLGPVVSRLGIGRIPITCVKFSPTGQTFATGSFAPKLPLNRSPGVVTIWNVDSGKKLASFDKQLGVVLSLDYSPDGRRIASSSINPDNTFVVWEAATGNVVQVVHGHASQIHKLRYSPDGTLIATADTNGAVRLWNAETFEQISNIQAHPAPAIGLAFTPDGRHYATAGEDGAVRVWETATSTKVRDLTGHTGSALAVAFSTDGKLIASGGFDKTVRLWDFETGREKITLRGHTDTVWSVTFSPDAKSERLVSASFDKTARIWDATPLLDRAGPDSIELVGHTDRVNTVAFSVGRDLLASGSWDKDVRLWDATTGAQRATLKGHTGVVWGVAISRDGGRVASASWDHAVKVWDTSNGQMLFTFSAHTAPVHAVAFSPDGKRGVSGGFDGQVKVWDATSGKLIANCDGFVFPVLSVAFSPDGSRIATGGSDRAVKIWDPKDGRTTLTLSGHEGAIHGLAFSPDGKRLASASWDQTVRIWNVDPVTSENTKIRTSRIITGHKDRIHCVTFSPDGNSIATASEDKTVRVWDVSTGKELSKPLHHRGVVWSVAFNSDGRRLATGCWYGGSWLKIWKIN